MGTERDSTVRRLEAALREGDDDERLLADLVDEGWSEDEANELLDEAEAMLDGGEGRGSRPEERGVAEAPPAAEVGPGIVPEPGEAGPRVGLRARALLTAAVAVGLGLLRFVPAPFDPDPLEDRALSSDWSAQFGPFAAGITPFFASFLLVELWAWLFRRGRRLGDRELRRRMTRWAVALGLLFALVQGWGIALHLASYRQEAGALSGPGFDVLRVLTIASGSALFVLAAFVVTRRGLGNGFAVVVLSGLLWSYGESAFEELWLVRQEVVRPAAVLVEALVFGGLFSAALWFFLRPGQGSSKLPARTPTSGLAPLTLAASVLLVPTTLANLSPGPSLLELAALLSPGSMPHAAVHVALVAGLVPLFSWIFYYRRQAAFGGPEVRPLWRDAMKRTAALLVGLAVLEVLLARYLPAVGALGSDLVGIIVAAAIVADLWQELRARRALRPGEDLAVVEVHHDVSDAVAASTRLAIEGQLRVSEETYRTVCYETRVVVVQGLCYRSLGYFFVPWVPLVVLSNVAGESSSGGALAERRVPPRDRPI